MGGYLSIKTKHRRILQDGRVVLASRSTKLFQFLLLLYLKKFDSLDGQGWVGLQEIQSLGFLQTSNDRALGTIIARFLEKLTKHELHIMQYGTRTRGPYSISLPLENIALDISVAEIRQCLNHEIHVQFHVASLAELQLFTRALVDGDVSLFGIGDYATALTCYTEAKHQLVHPLLTFVCMLRIFDVFYRLGQYSEAKHELEAMLTCIAEGQVVDPFLEARVQILAARFLYRQGKHQDVGRLLRRIKTSLPFCYDNMTLAEYVELQGLLARERALHAGLHGEVTTTAEEHAEKALTSLRQALYLRLCAGDYNGARNACYNIANTLYKLGNDTTYAFQYGHDVAEIKSWIALSDHIRTECISGGDTVLEKILLSSVLSRRERQDKEAERLITEAYAAAQKIGNLYDQGILLRQRAGIALRRGDTLAARAHLQHAVALLTRSGATEAVAHIQADFPAIALSPHEA